MQATFTIRLVDTYLPYTAMALINRIMQDTTWENMVGSCISRRIIKSSDKTRDFLGRKSELFVGSKLIQHHNTVLKSSIWGRKDYSVVAHTFYFFSLSSPSQISEIFIFFIFCLTNYFKRPIQILLFSLKQKKNPSQQSCKFVLPWSSI